MGKIAKTSLENGEFGTILSEDAELSGTFYFDKPLQVLGKVSGAITAKELVVIEEGATVEASIRASNVLVRGSVKGDITASKKVDVRLSAKLVGNVYAPEILMEPGCVFDGHCNMTRT